MRRDVSLAIGGAVVIGGAWFASEYVALHTGNSNLDRAAIRARVLWWSRVYGVDPRVMMAIVAHESGGDPAHYLGDAGVDVGPSVGPGQVLRTTAIAMGFIPEDTTADAYSQFAEQRFEGRTLNWAIRVFAEALRIAHGDVREALAVYNGGPREPAAAVAYAQGRADWLSRVYGVQV